MPVLSKKELNKMNKYFRALNYLSVAQLYLLDNPLVRRGLVITDIKPNVVGHWGTAPGQNFIYMHLNRIIKKYDSEDDLFIGLFCVDTVVFYLCGNYLKKVIVFVSLSLCNDNNLSISVKSFSKNTNLLCYRFS